MKRVLAGITALAISIIACSTPAQLPAYATQTESNTPITSDAQNIPPTGTKTPQTIIIVGNDTTWNIRTGPSLDYPVVGIAYGGEQFAKVGILGAWVRVDEGWICDRAFGGNGDCK